MKYKLNYLIRSLYRYVYIKMYIFKFFLKKKIYNEYKNFKLLLSLLEKNWDKIIISIKKVDNDNLNKSWYFKFKLKIHIYTNWVHYLYKEFKKINK